MMMNMISDFNQFNTLRNIEFEDIKVSEEIILETQNSCYRFSVTDAHQRRGYLSGGSLGDQAWKAILMGTIFKKGDTFTTDPWGLKTDARAIFYLETESGMKHLVTSVILKLTLVRTEEEPQYLF